MSLAGRIALAAALASTLTCRSSRAGPDPDVALFDAAVEDEQRDRWQAAREKLTVLVARRETAGVRFHLGHAAERLGEPCVALGEFERALRLADAEPSLRARAEARVAQARAATARVEVVVAPAVATVSIDGVSVSARSSICLTPGPHRVSAEAPGHQPAARLVDAPAGTESSVSLRLSPLGDARARATPAAPPRPRDETARWVLLGASGALAVVSGALWLERASLHRDAESCAPGCDRGAREAAASRTGRAAAATGALALLGGGVFVAWSFAR